MEWQFSGLGPGTYTFGTAPLTDMTEEFEAVPFIHAQQNNDGMGFVTARTTTGFTIVDRGFGPPPEMTITIIKT